MSGSLPMFLSSWSDKPSFNDLELGPGQTMMLRGNSVDSQLVQLHNAPSSSRKEEEGVL